MSSSLGKGYKQESPSINSSQSKFSEYLSHHEGGHVLNLIAALQLIPENYGKNSRIELMAIEAVKKMTTGKPGNLGQLRSIIKKEFQRHYTEDLPEELFTDNVLFHGGNYIVMPGIASYSSDIFKYLSEAIYTSENTFSPEFKNEIYQGVALLLNIGSTLFQKALLKRNTFVANHEEALEIPKQPPRLSFNLDELVALCAENNINPQTIEHFITEPDAPEFKYEDPSLSPLLFRPIVQFEGEYHLVLPSGQMSAINEFILNTTKRYGTREGIHDLCHKRIWRDLWGACDKIGWQLTDIPLPELEKPNPMKERIFQFDAYMLAYVCYSFPPELKGTYELHEDKTGDLLGGELINKRAEAVITNLKNREELKGYQFLTVLLTNTMGGFSVFGIDDPQEDEQRVWFNIFDFINMANADEWGRLDLWKYAKVYESTTKKTRIVVTSSMDAYVTYKRNGETFYLSDEHLPDFLNIVPGDGADGTRNAKIKSDMHGGLCLVNGSPAYLPVKRLRDYAPIFKPIYQRIPYEILLESYSFSIWVQNFQASNKTEADHVEHMADAICFWLDRLHPALHQHLEKALPVLLNIVLEFDQTYFSPLPLEQLDSADPATFEINCSYSDHKLTCKFPVHLRKMFVGGDNRGERRLMTEILKGFNAIPGLELVDDFIEVSIDQYVPLGQAKMVLMFDTRMDLLLDNRWLLPTLYISDAEVNLLLDKLVSIVNSPDSIPEKFGIVEEKKRFCNQVVLSLIQYLIEKLETFNNEITLSRLIDINESLIHNREFSKIHTAAKIHCFGNDEKELKEILKKERSLVNTSLSTRCLIEFIALNPATGNRKPSYDQLDELLTIMNEILNYGMQSDVLHYGMADPEMGLLPSGRIGISREFYDQKLQPFHRDNTIANIEAQVEAFSSQFETFTRTENDAETEAYYDKVDEAFLNDWGVDYTNLNGVCMQAALIAEHKQDSVVSMLEDELIAELSSIMPKATDQVGIALAKLCLEYDASIINIQNGYTNKEYFPWMYNREFSYARRPFVVVETEAGRRYYWGMRHCMAASRYLHQLLNSGQLTHGGPKINSLLGDINRNNGKQFRNIVANWLANNTTLTIWPYEVTMKPGGHFDADKDYGDCDIVAYNEVNNQLYNIECKRTEAARNIHQMKKEMDAYLGRDGQKKKIAKHVERDKWFQANLDQVQALVRTSSQPNVKSLILTSDLIPTRYLRAEDIVLPILSYQELKRKGVDALKNCQ